jgi:hypothetical protein
MLGDVNTMKLNVAPPKLIVPSGKLKPEGITPTAEAEPTKVAPSNAFKKNVPLPSVAKLIDTADAFALKAIVSGMPVANDGPV